MKLHGRENSFLSFKKEIVQLIIKIFILLNKKDIDFPVFNRTYMYIAGP